jgi:hypothetical protein
VHEAVGDAQEAADRQRRVLIICRVHK